MVDDEVFAASANIDAGKPQGESVLSLMGGVVSANSDMVGELMGGAMDGVSSKEADGVLSKEVTTMVDGWLDGAFHEAMVAGGAFSANSNAGKPQGESVLSLMGGVVSANSDMVGELMGGAMDGVSSKEADGVLPKEVSTTVDGWLDGAFHEAVATSEQEAKKVVEQAAEKKAAEQAADKSKSKKKGAVRSTFKAVRNSFVFGGRKSKEEKVKAKKAKQEAVTKEATEKEKAKAKEEKENAATMIQSSARQRAAQRRAWQVKEEKAATVIQSSARQKAAQRRAWQVKEEEEVVKQETRARMGRRLSALAPTIASVSTLTPTAVDAGKLQGEGIVSLMNTSVSTAPDVGATVLEGNLGPGADPGADAEAAALAFGMELHEKLDRMFNSVDSNNDGTVDKRELIFALRGTSENAVEVREMTGLPEHIRQTDGSQAQFERFFQDADRNDDRGLTLEEFVDYFLRGPPTPSEEGEQLLLTDEEVGGADQTLDVTGSALEEEKANVELVMDTAESAATEVELPDLTKEEEAEVDDYLGEITRRLSADPASAATAVTASAAATDPAPAKAPAEVRKFTKEEEAEVDEYIGEMTRELSVDSAGAATAAEAAVAGGGSSEDTAPSAETGMSADGRASAEAVKGFLDEMEDEVSKIAFDPPVDAGSTVNEGDDDNTADSTATTAKAVTMFQSFVRKMQARKAVMHTLQSQWGAMLAMPGTIQGRSGWYEYINKAGIQVCCKYDVDQESSTWTRTKGPLSRAEFNAAGGVEGETVLDRRASGLITAETEAEKPTGAAAAAAAAAAQ
jgi:hypothetical protein